MSGSIWNDPKFWCQVEDLLTKTEREGAERGSLEFEHDDEGYTIKPRLELIQMVGNKNPDLEA